MPRAMWKGAVSFGLVNVPVKLYSATEDHDISFRQVHREDGGRIHYKRVCAIDGEEVSYDDIAKGYETEDGEMVVITDDDLKNLPNQSSKEIAVEKFVPSEQVDPMLLDRSYYLEPEKGAAKAYALLRDALEAADRMALVSVAIRSRKNMAVLRVRDNIVVLQTMIWPDEVRSAEFANLGDVGSATERELSMATMLIDSLSGDYDPDEFQDDYSEAVHEMVEAKLSGGEVKHAPEPKDTGEVVDLLEALQRSVDRAKSARGEPVEKKAAPAKKTAAKKSTPAAKKADGRCEEDHGGEEDHDQDGRQEEGQLSARRPHPAPVGAVAGRCLRPHHSGRLVPAGTLRRGRRPAERALGGGGIRIREAPVRRVLRRGVAERPPRADRQVRGGPDQRVCVGAAGLGAGAAADGERRLPGRPAGRDDLPGRDAGRGDRDTRAARPRPVAVGRGPGPRVGQDLAVGADHRRAAHGPGGARRRRQRVPVRGALPAPGEPVPAGSRDPEADVGRDLDRSRAADAARGRVQPDPHHGRPGGRGHRAGRGGAGSRADVHLDRLGALDRTRTGRCGGGGRGRVRRGRGRGSGRRP